MFFFRPSSRPCGIKVYYFKLEELFLICREFDFILQYVLHDGVLKQWWNVNSVHLFKSSNS